MEATTHHPLHSPVLGVEFLEARLAVDHFTLFPNVLKNLNEKTINYAKK